MNPPLLLIALLIISIILIAGCANEKISGEVVKQTPETIEPIVNETPEELPSLEELIKEQEQEEPIIKNPTSMAIISIRNMKFIPSDISVSAGTTVIWNHEDTYLEDMPHKITIQGASGGVSPVLKYGDSYNYTFTKPDKYRFVDSIYVEKMTGSVNVD